jgi:uncharacterized protein HemX
MSERIDDFAKTVAERMTRRSALLGVGALALGSLGVAGFGQKAEANKNKKSSNNECNSCKDTCKRNNKKRGKSNPNNCSNKCRSKCGNNDK